MKIIKLRNISKSQPLAEATASWNETLAIAGFKGSVKINSSAGAETSGIVYTDASIPRAGVLKHSVGESLQEEAVILSFKPKDKTEKNGAAFVLHSNLLGHSRITLPGKENIHLKSGQCMLASAAEPSVHRQTGGGFCMIYAHIPERVLGHWAPFPQELIGRVIPDASWGHVLATSMQNLADPANINSLALQTDMLSEHLCSLLALFFSHETTPPSQALSSYNASIFKRLIRTLHDHYMDPDFNIAKLSLIHGIPTPTLYKIFAATGTTFETKLMSIRIHRAQQLLADSRFNKKTIAELSNLTGFINAGHFSTVFKRKTGHNPRTYRKIIQT